MSLIARTCRSRPRAAFLWASFLWSQLAFATLANAGTITVVAKHRDAQLLAGAVITLQGESPALPPAAPVKAIMDQINLEFVPDVLVIPLHSSVQFPNSDAISHQVYSFSNALKFQLPLYRGKAYPPIVFEQPGVITLGCNIHDNMLAYIVVTAAPFFGRTDSKGEWVASNVPNGRYLLRLWHPLSNEPRDVERVVEIGAGNETVEIRLTRNMRPAPLTGRPHSWDY